MATKGTANFITNWEITVLSDHPSPTQTQRVVALELFRGEKSVGRFLMYENEAKRLANNLQDGKDHPRRTHPALHTKGVPAKKLRRLHKKA